VDHRLRDPAEGRKTQSVVGNLTNANFNIGTNTFRNISAKLAPGAKAIEYNELEDAFVFCTTSGPYSADVHRQFREAGNASCTHYVVFDSDLLMTAVIALAQSMPVDCFPMGAPVRYGDKNAIVNLQELEAFARPVPTRSPEWVQKIIENVFVKPKRFSHEKEFRYALVSVSANKSPFRSALFLEQRPDALRKLFREAILESGSSS
jgi:hypothetical protein